MRTQPNKLLNDMGIKTKLRIVMLVGVMIPMLVLFALFSMRILNNLKEREEKVIIETIDEVGMRIEQKFEMFERLSFSIMSDNSIVKDLEEFRSEDDRYSWFTIFTQIDDRFRSHLYTYPELESIVLYHGNEALDFSGVVMFDKEKLKEVDELFGEEKNNFAMTYRIDHSEVYIEHIRKLNTISLDSNNHVRFTYVPGVMDEVFVDPLLDEYDAQFFLLNEQNQIIASNQPGYTSGIVDFVTYSDELTEEGFKVYSIEVDNATNMSQWLLIVNLDERIIVNNMFDELYGIVIAMFVVLVFSIILSQNISVNISRRLTVLNDAMRIEDQAELVRVSEDLGSDEIGMTAKYYNRMVYNTNQLTQEKLSAYEELEISNEELTSVNEELSVSNEEIRQQNITIHDLIYIDQLTGLKNRFAIYQEIDKRMKEKPSHHRIAVLFVDVDNFKNINDAYGHDVGDQVIAATAKKLQTFENKQIQIGRFGGDEFLVMVEGDDYIDNLGSFVKALEGSLARPIMLENTQFTLTVSIGVAIYPKDGRTKEELIKNSDQALYRAKDYGRNQTVFYDLAMNEALEKKMHLQNGMKVGLENKEFYLVFQPYMDAVTERVRGFEVLIRWNNQLFAGVSPYDLIVNAEETGFILELGMWIFEEACKAYNYISKQIEEEVTISINVSMLQVQELDFVEKIRALVGRYGIAPSNICLEMTETVLIKSFEEGYAAIQTLNDLGFLIALDDFGTGYSSLSYFKHLPVNILKIDKSFIKNIDIEGYDQELVEIMVQIAQNKQVKVTAEGVESYEQLEIVRRSGCDIVQGYYYSKPLEMEKLLDYIRSKSEG